MANSQIGAEEKFEVRSSKFKEKIEERMAEIELWMGSGQLCFT